MQDQLVLGALAVLAGVGVIAVAFVPYVAVSYRRHGRFSVSEAVMIGTSIVYLLAVWAYTLLPLPDPATLVCAGTNRDPLAFVDELSGAVQRADGRALAAISDPVVLQLALNVLLFIPLGALVRLLARRGVLVSAVAGLALSALIESTQLTGVWGLYPCAYRVFDVDDLITNTTGAVIGSLLALALPRTGPRGAADTNRRRETRAVTRPRRLLGMVCDLVAFTLIGAVVTVTVQAYLLYGRGDRQAVVDGSVGSVTGTLAALLVWLLITLTTGRSVGDLAVQLRYRGGPLPAAWARLLRFASGIGGYGLLTMLPSGWSALATVFAVLCVLTTLSTRDGRGLPGIVTGQSPYGEAAGARRRGDLPR